MATMPSFVLTSAVAALGCAAALSGCAPGLVVGRGAGARVMRMAEASGGELVDGVRRSKEPTPGSELPSAGRARRAGIPEPDPRLTPGAVVSDATTREVCQVGYARRERDVTIAMKRAVLRAYGMRYVPGRLVIDHLVPLELGGANVARDRRSGRIVVTANLWPQPTTGAGAAAIKDRLENYLHRQVCAGRVGLRDAQLAIARDWYEAWLRAGRP